MLKSMNESAADGKEGGRHTAEVELDKLNVPPLGFDELEVDDNSNLPILERMKRFPVDMICEIAIAEVMI